MRDDFSTKDKETLSKRVGFLCSNPECRKLTVGPNTKVNKATNIGVAAHITAASKGGPRFDKYLNSDQRSSINNGIWLCQTCSKLIDSDIEKYPKELLIQWKKKAEDYSESLLNQRNAENKRQFRIINQMPELINEMRQDLKENPLAMEFVLLSKRWTYNDSKGILCYFYEDHDKLDIKIRALEGIELVEDITWNNTKRYIFTEDFVELLLE